MDRKSLQMPPDPKDEAVRAEASASMNRLLRRAAGRGAAPAESGHGDEPALRHVPDFDAGARPAIAEQRSVNDAANDWMRASALGVHPSQLPAHMRSAA